MKTLFIGLLTTILALLVSGCHLFNKKDAEPQLPPATQNGSDTFGCKVNGKVWLPQGSKLYQANPSLSYDPSYGGGALILKAYQGDYDEYFNLSSFDVSKTGSYTFGDSLLRTRAHYSNYSTRCDYYSTDKGNYIKGTLIITKLEKRIIAGTFEFDIYKPGCDTVHVTEGRFDMALY